MKAHPILVVTALMFVPACIPHAAAQQVPAAKVIFDTDAMIEQLMNSIRASRKPLPVWALDTAMRAYTMWKTYKNGQKVEAMQLEVLAVLRTVAEIKDQVEAGREMSEREYKLARDLLDANTRRLNDLATRVDEVERATRELEVQVRGWRQRAQELEGRVFRRGCGVGHAWRNGKCVDVAANPR